MNRELVDSLRLDAGIAMLNDNGTMVAINKMGDIIDPLVGLQKFTELILAEVDNVFTNNFYGDPHELFQFIDDVKTHFGVK